MIREYYRPESLEAALALLDGKTNLVPMGGGTVVNRPGSAAQGVVDLQALRLDQIQIEGNQWVIGATATLETIANCLGLAQALVRAVQLELPINLRQMATAAGQLVAAHGRSTYATAMLALEARLTWEPGKVEIALGDWLPLRASQKPGHLITSIRILQRPKLVFESIGRMPEDLPLVCIAAAYWPSGRTRIALGGFGAAPIVAFDGPDPGGAEAACQDAYSQAGDAWASAEYRSEMAAVLARRAVSALVGEGKSL